MIFPVAKLKKDNPKKRKGTNIYLKLRLSKPFDTFKAQVLQKINEQTKPQKISYDNYKALYTIPRVSPTLMSLSNEKDYKEFIRRITKAKGLTASLYIQELRVLKVLILFLLSSRTFVQYTELTGLVTAQGPSIG